MNKSFLKVILRKIRDRKAEFISTFVISAIGVAMLCGVMSVPYVMQKNAQKYFNEQNMADITLTKNTSFTNEEIKLIKETSNYQQLEQTTVFDGIVTNNNKEYTSRVHSNKTISKPAIIQGRNIKNDTECLVDKYGASLLNKTIEIEALNTKNKCKVVGIVNAVEYFNNTQKGYSTISNGEVKLMVFISYKKTNDFLTYAPIKNNYLYLNLKDKPNNDTFSNDYQDYLVNTKHKLEKKLSNDININLRHELKSVSNYYDDSSQISEIAAIFPIIFFLVAALVASSTMSRIIENDRNQIGTFSAMGYSRFSISSIYMTFSFISVTLGLILGSLLGFNLIPPMVMQAYSSIYQLVDTTVYYDTNILNLALIASYVMILGSTILVISFTTKESCASLMRPKSPVAGKKIFLEKLPFIWSRFSFLRKVSMRNLLRYKKRLIMSILAIMACSGLLMTGLGIKTSFSPVIDLQYNKIYQYQSSAYTIPLTNKQTTSKQTKLNKNKDIQDTLSLYQSNASTFKDDKEYKYNVVVPNNNQKLNQFVKFNSKDFNENDVYISKKLSILLNLKENDTIKIKIDKKDYSFKVTKIVEQYIGNYLYINNKAFSKVKPNFTYNNILIKHTNSDSALSKQLKNQSYIQVVDHNSNTKANIAKSLNGVNNIVYIMIGFAGVLVLVVMYSLTSINISERTREIATLKVLGFYDKEVDSYVFRENILLTLFGLLIGLGFGKYLHIYIISKAELEHMYFLKTQPLTNFIITAIFTLVLSMSINLIMKSKTKQINMVDSLKSIE